jgi:hypothetical protein
MAHGAAQGGPVAEVSFLSSLDRPVRPGITR